ncbi:hypothetical protein G7085_12115 [Tessaracoccus sp. HDW20]|uniref:hypothetical protein n=1 Tax=Tessaracoccus coleopterorum TaxID=2714950 RepID=UPI0018D42650|nr:hypothetical protein [Tessaracoccus coleopterorum]NHB85112.1 hypothetical protein [Tessaracoccus coleopterorum]
MTDLSLPYRDVKPQGAADFYFAINATFAHIRDTYGHDALHDYWTELGNDYQRPVWQLWSEGGLPAVETYWRDFFSVEPGGEVVVSRGEDRVTVDVRSCPAIAHLRANGRDIVDEFCQQCVVMGNACATGAGLRIDVAGGNGRCVQTITHADDRPAQDPTTVDGCATPREG